MTPLKERKKIKVSDVYKLKTQFYTTTHPTIL